MSAAVKRYLWFPNAMVPVERPEEGAWVKSSDYEAALSLLRQARDVCATLSEYEAGDEIPPHLTEAAKEALAAIDLGEKP